MLCLHQAETDLSSLLGSLLKKWMKMALEQQQVHGDELKSFTEARGEVTKDWLKMITDWEEDQERPEAEQVGVPNPYDLPKGGMSVLNDYLYFKLV